MSLRSVCGLVLTVLVLSSGHVPSWSDPIPAEKLHVKSPGRLASAGLPNAIRLNDRVISGGLPRGESAFQELRALGVTTVISVDAVKPEIALAKKHSLRYVHLPHGYDGIPENRVQELAAAVKRSSGPVYIHCHHGKHRSPTAAAVACIATGLMQPADALAVLKMAETNENYRGLFQAVQAARRLSDRSLDDATIELPELAELPPLAEAMASVDLTYDRLKAMAGNRWSPPTDEPDLDPRHEALLLREQFAELIRSRESANRPKQFQQLLRDAETAAADLKTSLRTRSASERNNDELSRLNRALETVTQKCAECHRTFRDVPLGERQHGG